MKRLVLVLGGLLVILVGVAVAAPSFIDWNQYKPLIAEKAEEATGRKLQIDGDLSAQILPYPALTVEQVRFENAEGADEADMAKLEALQISVALLPLFSGEVRVSTVRLIGADILLEQYKDGTNNWTLALAEEEAPVDDTATEGDEAGSGARIAIAFEDVVISDARIRYADRAAGTVEEVRIPELDIMVGSLQGPFRLTGQVIGRGLPLDVDIALATLEPGRSIPITAEIKNDDAGLRLLTSAALLGLEDEPRINGKLTVEVADLAALMAVVGGGSASNSAQPLSLALETSVRASAVAVTLTDTAVTLGGEKLTGGLDVSLADPLSLDVRMKGGSIDLDALMPKLMALGAAGGGNSSAASASASGGTPGAEAPFDIPRDLTGAIDLSIDALTYNGETARNATLKAAIGGGVVTLTQVGADLPAAAKLSAHGTLRARSGKPYFNGGVKAGAPDMRALMQFVGADVAAIPQDKLKRFDASLNIVGGPENLAFSNISVALDQLRISGDAAIGLTGVRPSVKANLSMNALDADAYLPPAAASDGSGARKPAAKAKADKDAGGPFAALASADADIAVRVGSLTYQGSNYRDVTLGIDLANKADGTGALEASAKMGGLTGGITAHYISTAASVETAPLSVKLFIKATSATAIAKALGNGDKAPPRHLDGPVSFTADIAGNAADASMTALLKTAQGNAKLNGNVKDAMGKPKFALALDAVAPAYRSFMSSLGLPYNKAAPVGAMTLSGKVRGSTEELVVDEIAFAAGENTFKGTMTVNLSSSLVRPQIDATLSAGTMNLDALMPKGSTTQNVKQQPAGQSGSSGAPWSDEPLPLDGLKAADANVSLTAKTFLGFGVLFEDADLKFVLKDGVAGVERFTGKLYGGPMDMKGSFGPQKNAQGGTSSVPVLDMTFTLSQSNIATLVKTLTGNESMTGLMDAKFTLKGAGNSSRTLVQSLNGSGAISGEKGAFVGFDVSALAKAVKSIDNPSGFAGLLGTALSGGQTNFNDLDLGFDIKNGVMTTKEARTDIDQAEMRLNAVIDLPKWYLDSRADLVLEGNSNLPAVGMKFFGPLDNPKRKVDTDSLTRYAAEKAISAGIANLFGGGKKKDPTPAPQQPAPQQPAPEQPAPQQPAPQQPAQEQPAPQQPAPEQPAQEQPAQAPAPEQQPEPAAEPENGPLEAQEADDAEQAPPQEEQPAAPQQPQKQQQPDPAEVFKQLFGK